MSTHQPRTRTARVVFREEGKGASITIEGTRELRDRVGHDVLAALLKCFYGLDRLISFEHLLVLNDKLDHGSIAYCRNLRLLANQCVATLYELGEALQELCNARVVEKVTDRSLWTPINDLRARLRGDARISKTRNQLGAHLGDIEAYRQGLERVLAGKEDVLFEIGDSPTRSDGECQLAGEVLLAGLSIDTNDMKWVMQTTYQVHIALADQLAALFKDILTTVGIDLVRE